MKKTLAEQKLQASSEIREIKELGISALKSELEDGKKELQKLVASIDRAKNDHSIQVVEYEKELSSLREEIDSKKEELAVVTESFRSLTDRNVELESTIKVLEGDIEGLRNTKHTFDLLLDEVKQSVQDTNTQLDALKDDYNRTVVEMKTAVGSLEYQKDELEKSVEALEEKKLIISQEIISERESQRMIAENLAIRQRELDDKDQNIRIREEKLRHREKIIVKNSNLLNL